MLITSRIRHRRSALALIAAAASFAALPAQAQQFRSEGASPVDPLIQLGEWEAAGRNHFFINDDNDVEVIRFRSARDVEMCAGSPRLSPEGRLRGYAIQVSWDNESAVIQPGNCMSFDAQRVRVRAAGNLPQNVILEGTYRVLKQ